MLRNIQWVLIIKARSRTAAAAAANNQASQVWSQELLAELGRNQCDRVPRRRPRRAVHLVDMAGEAGCRHPGGGHH